MITGYKELKAGDVRQYRDEQRENLGPRKGSYEPGISNPEAWGGWTRVERLLGHPILGSDLMNVEFRRPLI